MPTSTPNPDESLTLEEMLHRIEDGAAFPRYAAESAAGNATPPDTKALSGWADACAEVERLARHALIQHEFRKKATPSK